jgi:hypothetical protein
MSALGTHTGSHPFPRTAGVAFALHGNQSLDPLARHPKTAFSMNQATVGSDNFAVVKPDNDALDELSHSRLFHRSRHQVRG